MKCKVCGSSRGIRTYPSGIGTRIECNACGYVEVIPDYIR